MLRTMVYATYIKRSRSKTDVMRRNYQYLPRFVLSEMNLRQMEEIY